MAFSLDKVQRVDEVGGKDVRTFLDTVSNVHYQGVVLADQAGAQVGIQANPLWTYVKSTGIEDRLKVDGTIDIFQATFARWFSNKWITIEVFDRDGPQVPGYTFDNSGGVLMVCGLSQSATAAVRSKFEPPDINGIGTTIGFTLKLTDVAVPESGQTKRWGLGDTNNGIFVEWVGADSEVRLRSYNNGVLDINILGSAWDTPVQYSGGSGLLTQLVQEWVMNIDWLHRRVQVFLDGTLVQDNNLIGASITTLTRDRIGRMNIEITNTATITNGNEIYVYGMYALVHGSKTDKWMGTHMRRAGISGIPIGAGGQGCILNCHFRPTRVIGPDTILNNRVARVRKLIVSCYATTGGLESLDAGHFKILKGHHRTAGFPVFNESPRDPGNAWSGIAGVNVALTATIGTIASTLNGYADNDTVQYKITVLGAIGETSAGVAGTAAADYLSAVVNVATPAQEVVVGIAVPVAEALAYNIYRQINAAGNFELIATVDATRMEQVGFTDIGYRASATVPPVADTSEAETFMEAHSLSTHLNLDGATPVGTIAVAANTVTLEFEDGELNLMPGETLAIYADFTLRAIGCGAWMVWDEEAF